MKTERTNATSKPATDFDEWIVVVLCQRLKKYDTIANILLPLIPRVIPTLRSIDL